MGKAFIVFGAVDFHARVYVNGEFAGEHFGGYTTFRIDATPFLKEGDNVITVYAEDDTRDPLQARGKQSQLYYSHSCDYTRTTGIWQTVYMEFCPKDYIKSVKYYPNIIQSRIREIYIQWQMASSIVACHLCLIIFPIICKLRWRGNCLQNLRKSCKVRTFAAGMCGLPWHRS